jgi:hypothetical protein
MKERWPESWISTCLHCGRGIGPAGVVFETPQPPRRDPTCRHCQGAVTIRQVTNEALDRLMRQPATTDRRWGDD